MKPKWKPRYGVRYVLFAALLLNGLVLGLMLISGSTSRSQPSLLIHRAERLIGELGKDAGHDEMLRLWVGSLLKRTDRIHATSVMELESAVTKLALLGIGNLMIFLALYIVIRKETDYRPLHEPDLSEE